MFSMFLLCCLLFHQTSLCFGWKVPLVWIQHFGKRQSLSAFFDPRRSIPVAGSRATGYSQLLMRIETSTEWLFHCGYSRWWQKVLDLVTWRGGFVPSRFYPTCLSSPFFEEWFDSKNPKRHAKNPKLFRSNGARGFEKIRGLWEGWRRHGRWSS